MEERLMITVDEEKFFDIMCDYSDIALKLDNFLIVLKALKEHYDAEMKNEMYANLSVIVGYLELLQAEFAKTITRTDEFLLK